MSICVEIRSKLTDPALCVPGKEGKGRAAVSRGAGESIRFVVRGVGGEDWEVGRDEGVRFASMTRARRDIVERVGSLFK